MKIEPREKWAESWNTDIVDILDCLKDLAIRGLMCDPAICHKNWYLERILQGLGVDLTELREELQAEDYDWEDGIAP